jgi:hypothetical protein
VWLAAAGCCSGSSAGEQAGGADEAGEPEHGYAVVRRAPGQTFSVSLEKKRFLCTTILWGRDTPPHRLRCDSLMVLIYIGPHGQCGRSLAVTARLEL